MRFPGLFIYIFRGRLLRGLSTADNSRGKRWEVQGNKLTWMLVNELGEVIGLPMDVPQAVRVDLAKLGTANSGGGGAEESITTTTHGWYYYVLRFGIYIEFPHGFVGLWEEV